MVERETGTVKWFNDARGYGFIARDIGGDVFVHHSEIRGIDRQSLHEGQRVEFKVVQGERGPRVEDVTVLA